MLWLWGRKKSEATAAASLSKPQLDLGGVVPARWSEALHRNGAANDASAASQQIPNTPPVPQAAVPVTQSPATEPADPTRSAPAKLAWFALRSGLYAGSLVILAAGLWVGANIFYYTLKFPDPLAIADDRKTPTLRILARDGSLLAERGTAHPYMPLAMLPRHVVDAVVSIEDRRFFEHWGVDPIGLMRATIVNLRAGRFVQGGSTLTQQLAKNMFLSAERTMTRKLDELVISVWLEARLTKEEILELYLNRVYFGGGAYGIEAAAQLYFDKSARAVTVAEAAVLAGLLKAPSRYAPTANPGLARARGRIVLATMLDAGSIDEASLARARSDAIRFAKPQRERMADANGYAVDYILDSMPELIQGGSGEVIVETTIDAPLQKNAQASVARLIAAEGKSRDASQAALVVLDPDGGVRALVGGADYRESQFNRAVKAKRQPGSTFKPFVYLSALENGMTPDTVTYDLPISIDGWSPRNANGRYTGAVSLRDALARSINTVAVRLTLDAGPEKVAAIARRLGIGENLVAEPSIALGASEVSLIDLTSAYAVFAADGRKVSPHVIDRIRTTSGRVLYAYAPEGNERLVSRPHVAAMSDMLNAALVTGTGRQAGLPEHPAAGKTGTSQDFRDAWFVGYSARLIAGVWVGNDRGTPMQHVSGGALPARIWRDVMSVAHRGLDPVPLPGTSWEGTRISQAPAVFRDGNGVASLGPEPVAIPPVPARRVAVSGSARTPRPLSVARSRKAPEQKRSPAGGRRLLTSADRNVARAPAGQRIVIRPPAPVPEKPKATPHPAESIPADVFLQAAAASPREAAAKSMASAGFDAEDIRRRLAVGANQDRAASTPSPQDMSGRMALGGTGEGF